MPIIKKEQSFFMGEAYMLSVRVLADGLFRFNLPPTVEEALGKKEVVAETYNEAWRQHAATLKEFEEGHTTVTRVILYRIKYNGTIWDSVIDTDKKEARDGRVLLNRKNIPVTNQPSFPESLTVGITAGVFDKSTFTLTTGKERSTYKQRPVGDQFAHGCSMFNEVLHMGDADLKELLWTVERHRFFDELCIALSKVIYGVHGLAKDTKSLAEHIDRGIGLLGGGEGSI